MKPFRPRHHFRSPNKKDPAAASVGSANPFGFGQSPIVTDDDPFRFRYTGKPSKDAAEIFASSNSRRQYLLFLFEIYLLTFSFSSLGPLFTLLQRINVRKERLQFESSTVLVDRQTRPSLQARPIERIPRERMASFPSLPSVFSCPFSGERQYAAAWEAVLRCSTNEPREPQTSLPSSPSSVSAPCFR